MIVYTGAFRIGGVSTSVPQMSQTQKELKSIFSKLYSDLLTPRALDVLFKALENPGIQKRHFAVDDFSGLIAIKDETTDQRIERFTRWSTKLSAECILKLLTLTSAAKDKINALVVNTCTGYVCPGLSSYIIEDQNLPDSIQSFDLAGAGCSGAIPNLQLAHALLSVSPESMVIGISVEICSATYQMGNDLSLVISNAIFGDGAAGYILWDKPSGPQIVATDTRHMVRYRDHVRYIYRDGQLFNSISPQLPKIIAQNITPFLLDFLSSFKLNINNIKHWAIHAGGDRILTELQQSIGLTDKQLAPSRFVLSQFGNLSSPSALYALDYIIKECTPEANEWGIVLTFGAGFSMHAMLLRW